MEGIIHADFHMHTKYSIEPRMFKLFEARARYGPKQLIETAKKRGLNAITITDHDTMAGAEIGEKYNKKDKDSDFLVIKGEEISSADGHILGIGMEEAIRPGLPAQETIDRINSQGAVAIIPHPFAPKYGLRRKVFEIKNTDGIEVFNPFTCMVLAANKKAVEAAKLVGLSEISSTDAHTLDIVGKAYTKIKCDLNVDSVIKAIKSRKTVPFRQVSFVGIWQNVMRNTGLTFVSWYKKPKV